MAIPDLGAFESFLSSCSIVAERPKGPWLLFSESRLDNKTGRTTPELFLQYPHVELQLDSVLKKIEQTLADAGSTATRDVAIATLGLIVETRDPAVPAVGHANAVLGLTHSAQLALSIVAPNRLGQEFSHTIGGYSLRRFNPDRLLYWAKKCRVAYPIDLRNLSGWLALEHERIDVQIVDWTTPTGLSRMLQKWGKEAVTTCLLDSYYQAVAVSHASDIKRQVKADLLVLESGAMAWFDIDGFVSSPFLKAISLFQWRANSSMFGWALFGDQVALHCNIPPEGWLAASREWLAKELGFTELHSDNELDRGVESYCRFLQRAHGHRLSARPDEAFLHFAIALDLLLGSEGRSSDSVATRAALLVHRQLGITLAEQTKRVKRLYDVRSKYVHEGRAPANADLEEVERTCSEVLWAILAASAGASFPSVDKWVRRIDYLAAALVAGVSLNAGDLEAVGVAALGLLRRPPNRVADGGPRSQFVPMHLWEARRRCR